MGKKSKDILMKRNKGIFEAAPHMESGGYVGAGLIGGDVGHAADPFINGLGQNTQNLASAFTAQNGFQAQLAPTVTSNYSPVFGQAAGNALNGQNVFNQNQMQQQQLAQALQQTAQGQGFNPAQAMLHQATGQNVQQQAALMGSQRGVGANAGLLARQAAQQGAGIQQQSANQAATLQAQQSLGAQQQQAALLGQMGQQNIGQQQVQSGLFGAATGAQNAQNANQVQNYGMAQGLNQQTAQNNTNAVNKTTGGFLNSLGGALGLAKGGMVPDHLKHVHASYYSDGGEVNYADPNRYKSDPVPEDKGSPMSGITSLLGMANGGEIAPQDSNIFQNNSSALMKAYMKPPESEEGEDQLTGDQREWMVRGGSMPSKKINESVSVENLKKGGQVGGEAQVAGDSIQNDTQPAMLSPMEIVLPRSVTLSDDPAAEAAKFVAGILKAQGHGNSNHRKEFHKALKQAILSRKK